MGYTAKQVMEDGRRIGITEHEDGTAEEVRELGGILFQLGYNRNGYRTSFWCIGKAARAAREYGIDLTGASR
ncbi:MAG: hypothetical protein ACFN02_11500 [Olsenella profusa]